MSGSLLGLGLESLDYVWACGVGGGRRGGR